MSNTTETTAPKVAPVDAETILPLLWNQQSDAGGTRSRHGEPEGKIKLHRLEVDKLGYDAEGNYWGVPNNTSGRVFIAEAGPNYRKYTWAFSREQAADNLKINPKDLFRRL